MSNRDARVRPVPDGNGTGLPRGPGLAPAHGFWWKTWQVLKVFQARLRFVAILAVIGLVVGYWDTIAGYYEKWTRPLYGQQEAAVSDVEYYCPMHPFIVRDNAREKCPICHMDLAQKGADSTVPLPPGTVSRVQLTPYREVLAGVQTTEIGYRPVARELTTFGSVEFNEKTEAHVATRQKGRIVKLYANFTGETVDKGDKLAELDVRYSPELMATLDDLRRARQQGDRKDEANVRQRLQIWDVGDEQIEEFLKSGKVSSLLTLYAPMHGHVVRKYQREGSFVDEGTPLYDIDDLQTVWIEAQVYEADQALLRPNLPIRATTLSLPNEVFRGNVDFIYPHLDERTRTLTVRFQVANPGHKLRPGMYATVTLDIPPVGIRPLLHAAGEAWAWDATADLCLYLPSSLAGPSPLLSVAPLFRQVSRMALLSAGMVLAIPDSAVIDTGNLKIVYRQSMPGTYEGVAVELGPRMMEAGSLVPLYPVLKGLAEGDRVVINGAFLIDAETRLNPAAGSIYYGGSAGKGASGSVAVRPSTPEAEDAQDLTARAELARLSAPERRLAEAQKFCPIRPHNRLGAMGPPLSITLEGQTVFLCCGGCEKEARDNPQKTLARVEELRRASTQPEMQSAPTPAPTADAKEAAKVRANLAKLSPEDRRLAEQQGFCPVQTDNRLGTMGMPIKVMIQGQPVFLCCPGCREDALAHPEETLSKVKELNARK